MPVIKTIYNSIKKQKIMLKVCDKLTEYFSCVQNASGNNWEPFLPVAFLASSLFPFKEQQELDGLKSAVIEWSLLQQ